MSSTLIPIRSSRTRRLAAVIAQVPLALLMTQAEAQDAVTLDQLSVEGEAGIGLDRAAPAGLNLRTPDRAASRLGLTLLETPASVDIVSGETARLRGQDTIADAVTQDATGITTIAAPGNGNGAFTSRGFAGPNSIQQLYDGTRLYVGAGTVTFPFDTWNVERIEVLRGPSSVLYGDGAIGGVINVVTKKPTFVPINTARAVVGSDGVARLAFDSGGGIAQAEFGDTFAYRLNVSGNRADGWVRPEGDFRNLAVSAALLFRPSADFAVTLSHDLGYQEPARYWGTPLVEGRIPDLIRFNNYNVHDAKITWADNWTQLKSEWSPTADITIRNTAYRLTSSRHWLDVEQYAFNRQTGLVDRSDYLEIYHSQEQIGDRLDATFRGDILGRPNQFVAGFDVNRIDFRHTNNFYFDQSTSVLLTGYDPGLFPQDGRAVPAYATRTTQVSVFAEDRLQLTDRLSFLTGVRFDVPTLHREDLQTGAQFDRTFHALGRAAGVVLEGGGLCRCAGMDAGRLSHRQEQPDFPTARLVRRRGPGREPVLAGCRTRPGLGHRARLAPRRQPRPAACAVRQLHPDREWRRRVLRREPAPRRSRTYRQPVAELGSSPGLDRQGRPAECRSGLQ